jgi:hypothetical protein
MISVVSITDERERDGLGSRTGRAAPCRELRFTTAPLVVVADAD